MKIPRGCGGGRVNYLKLHGVSIRGQKSVCKASIDTFEYYLRRGVKGLKAPLL